MYPLVLAWWRQHVVTSIAKWRWTGVILIASNMVSSLLPSSNNSISSFYWTRGSKLCLFTGFSYFGCYFLMLGFLHSHYLLVSLCLSQLHRNLISHPIFSYLGHSEVVRCMCTPMFLAHIVHFLIARRLWDPGTRLSTGFISHFHLLPKVSDVNVHWAIDYHTFLYT